MKKLVAIDSELVIEFRKLLSFDGKLRLIRSGCVNWSMTTEARLINAPVTFLNVVDFR